MTMPTKTPQATDMNISAPRKHPALAAEAERSA